MNESEYSRLMVDAALHAGRNRWDEALACLFRAEKLARGLFGPDDPRLAKTLRAKAKSCRELRRPADAERADSEASIIDLGVRRRNGLALARRQRYKEAENEYLEALRICMSLEALGPQHRETATCLDNLATCLRSQSRYIEATTHCRKAMEIRVAVLGKDHGHTAQSYANLGFLLSILGQHAEAERLLLKSLDVRKRVYGARHHYVAESLDRVASLYRTLGRFEDALPLATEALSIRRVELGPEHPLSTASLHNLALIRERRRDRVETGALTVGESSVASKKVAGASASKARGDEPSGGAWALGFLAAASVILVGAVVTAIIFTPFYAVVVVAPIVMVAACMALIDYFELESLKHLGLDALRWRIIRIRGMDDVDRDRLVLGRKTANGHTSTAEITRKPHLEVKDAREFVGFKSDPLDLEFVHSLTLAAADQLAKHRGTLKLNGLTELRSKLARSLRWHEGRLELNGVHELTEAAAAHIARHVGDLSLNGLRDLPQFVARHLAHHRGTLTLNGVRSLNEDAAGWLIKHRGVVQLRECRLTSYETKQALRTNAHIEFPDPVA